MKSRPHYLLFLLAFCWSSSSFTQSLIPNGSFEQLLGCPTTSGEITLAQSWSAAGGTSDLFNFCHVNGIPSTCNDVSIPTNFAGHSNAFSGSSYAGLVSHGPSTFMRSYIQTQLIQNLQTDSLYRLIVNYRRSSNSKYATNNLGAVFSTSALNQIGSNPILVAPQAEVTSVIADTGSWSTHEFYYIAAGGEAYLTIGNFRSDAQTSIITFINPPVTCSLMDDAAYYYVDDLSLIKVTETIEILGDTAICLGEQISLNAITNTEGFWSTATQPNDTLANGSNVLVESPLNNTTYIWNGINTTLPINVSVTPEPVFDLGTDTIVCSNDTVVLVLNIPNATYLWSSGSTSADINATAPGHYIVTVTVEGCAVSDSIT